jgi:RepB DNA-primase from phage plasmid
VRVTADAPTLSVVECEQFIRFWTEATDTVHVTLVAILPDSNSVHAKTFIKDEVEDACNWIADHQLTGRNIYFQPNETSPNCVRKPRKADMVAVNCRFADIDPDDEHYPLIDERYRLRQLAEHLSRDPSVAPTAIIDSGSGVQLLWAVTREPLDEAVVSRVEAETRDIEAALGAGGTHNVDRLLRLPGTVNLPNAAKQRRGRVVSRARLIFGAANLYRPDEVATLAAQLTALLADTGLIRPKGAKANGNNTADDADVAGLIRAMEQAGADTITRADHLPADLHARLYKAIALKPRLAHRWAGKIDDLVQAGRDVSRSGVDLSLAAMLKAAGFAHLDVALILCAFPHGKANNDEWPNPRQRLRHVARCVLRSYELPATGTAAILEEFNDIYLVVNEAGKAVVYAPTIDPILRRRYYHRITFDDLKRLYLNRRLEVGRNRRAVG